MVRRDVSKETTISMKNEEDGVLRQYFHRKWIM